MKKTALALLFAATFANAAEVKVTGYGSNYDAALENAKVAALEQGASTFVMSERNARSNHVTESIDEYTSGVIKSYKVVSKQQNTLGYEVTIIADVVPKDNTIKKGKQSSFSPDFTEYERREKIVSRLDNVGHALYADVQNPNYKIGRTNTTVYADVVISWQQKWVSDMRAFSTTINEKGSTSTNTHGEIAAGVSNAVKSATGNGLLGWLAWEAAKPAPAPEWRDNQMVCFGAYRNSTVDCYNIDVDFAYIPRNPKLVMIATVDGQQIQLYEQYVDMQLYTFASAGDVWYNKFFPQHKTTMNQPAFMVYEKESQKMQVKFDVNNELMKRINNVQIYIR
jgi:hypothetical protein